MPQLMQLYEDTIRDSIPSQAAEQAAEEPPDELPSPMEASSGEPWDYKDGASSPAAQQSALADANNSS